MRDPPGTSTVTYVVCALSCWFAWPGTAAGQVRDDAELIQEFFIAETVFPQNRYELQVTVGADHRSWRGSRVWRLPVLVEFGLSDRLQVAAEVPFVTLSSVGREAVRGWGNAVFGLAYGLRPRIQSTAVTIGLEVGFPGRRADSLVAEREIAWEPGIVLARQFGPTQVHVGLGVELGEESSFSADLALVVPIGAFRVTTELNWLGGDEPILFFTPGVVWPWADGWEVGAGIPIGLTADGPRTNLIVKLTYEVAL